MGTDIHMRVEVLGYRNEWESMGVEPYEKRNYVVFSVLAGVRNGYGFAGVPLYYPIKPISPPKGLPPGYDYYLEDIGDHSYSWLYASEIDSYDWDQVVRHYGVISVEEARKRNGLNEPDDWCGSISGGGSLTQDWEEYINNPNPDCTHVRVFWDKTLRESCADFLDWWASVPRHKDRAYRLVFGFDS